MEQAAIEIQGLTVRTRRGYALADVGLMAYRGEMIAIFGPPGSGKTTLLQAVSGKSSPDSGHVRILGALLMKKDPRVELAPGSPGGATPLLWLSKRASALPGSQRTSRVTRALELLDLFELRDTPLRELSAGQQRAVALAAVFSSPAPIVLIDGLLDSLPEPLFNRAYDHLGERVRKESGTVLLATVRSEIAEQADRVLMLEEGRALAFEPPGDLLAAYASDMVTIEGIDESLVRGTLRGVFDVEIEETPDGARFASAVGESAAAEVFRHPPKGARAVFVRRPTLWDVYGRIHQRAPEPGSAQAGR